MSAHRRLLSFRIAVAVFVAAGLAVAARQTLTTRADAARRIDVAGMAATAFDAPAPARGAKPRAADPLVLEKALRRNPRDPQSWSDLATLRLERATAHGRASELPQALVAADRALRLDPRLGPALFARAEVVDALGFRREAVRAWQAYLDTDQQSEWSSRALQRLHLLSAPKARPPASLDRVDPAEAASLTASFPQHLRSWAELEGQSLWACAQLAGNEGEAGRYLSILRSIANALQKRSGEMFLADAVARIDRATTEERNRLAQAQLTYRGGRVAMRDGRLTEALEPLRAASREFARLGSPMHGLSLMGEGATLMMSQRYEAAIPALEELERVERNDAERHPALAAYRLWHLGLCESVRGRWSVALDALSRSRATFARLGERGYEARVQTILGEAYDTIGQPGDGWRERVAATHLLEEIGDSRSVHIAAAGSTFAAIATRDWEAARSLAAIDRATAAALDASDADLIARSFLRTAIIELRRGNTAAAADALRTARGTATKIPDRAAASRTKADLAVAEALLLRDDMPARSLELLDHAIDLHRHAGLHAWLPALHLERGRTYLRMRDDVSASREFDEGIAALLAQRERLPSPELRTGIFDNTAALFDEALVLALREHDYPRAFRIGELSRARALLDEIAMRFTASNKPPDLTELRSQLGDAVFLQFTVMPEKTVAFVVTQEEMRVFEVAAGASELEEATDRLTALITTRGAIRELHDAAGSLFETLIAPATAAAAGRPLVISADGPLQRVPWAMLYDRGTHRYLVEDHTILVTPAAAIWLANSRRAAALRAAPPRTALVIGNPLFDRAMFPGLAALPDGEEEAIAIRRQYADGETWLRRDATRTRFVDSAPHYDVVHYAGHALDGLAGGEDSFLLMAKAGSDSGSLLYTADVMRMKFDLTRIVVLAACGSLRGTTRGKEGMPSIARGFLAAGVPAVAGTLWDVDDAVSKRLFSELHRHIARGLSPEIALRETQLQLIHSGNPLLSHAAAWAGTQIVGGSAASAAARAN